MAIDTAKNPWYRVDLKRLVSPTTHPWIGAAQSPGVEVAYNSGTCRQLLGSYSEIVRFSNSRCFLFEGNVQ